LTVATSARWYVSLVVLFLIRPLTLSRLCSISSHLLFLTQRQCTIIPVNKSNTTNSFTIEEVLELSPFPRSGTPLFQLYQMTPQMENSNEKIHVTRLQSQRVGNLPVPALSALVRWFLMVFFFVSRSYRIDCFLCFPFSILALSCSVFFHIVHQKLQVASPPSLRIESLSSFESCSAMCRIDFDAVKRKSRYRNFLQAREG
jgi:hypothetical protein